MAINSQNDSSSESLLDELAEEFTQRFRRGEHPALSEYVQRHPELEPDIRELFPALVEMEQLHADRPATEKDDVIWTNRAGERLQVLGDYRIIREIGRGGMGVVFEVEQISLGRRVALKALPAQFTAHTNQQERFSREARAAARLHHTNIVPVFGVGEQDGVPYYVMQYIRGLGLDAVLQELRTTRSAGTFSTIDRRNQRRPESRQQTAAHRDFTVEEAARSLQNGGLAAHGVVCHSVGDHTCSEAARDPSSVEPRDAASRRVSIHHGAVAGDAAGSTDVLRKNGPSAGLPAASSSSGFRHSYAYSVARLGLDVADAIHYAHSMGVQHRDIKPSNLLIDESGAVWVTDFGLAKVDDLPDLTRPGDFLGTLRYSAPEVLNGQAGPLSDQFSLAVTLYEMLTLQPAFTASSPPRLIEAIREGTVVPIRQLVSDVPADLDTIVRKAMSPLPQDRYRNLKALRNDLQRFLAGEPIHARRFNPLQRMAKWSARRPAIAGLLMFSLLSVCAFFLLLIMSRDDLRTERDAARQSEQLATRRKQEAESLRITAEQSSVLLAANLRRLRSERAEDLLRSGQSSAAVALLAQVLRDNPRDHVATYRLVSALEQFRFMVPATPPLLHEDDVDKARMSPDGRWIASADVAGRISIWRLRDGTRVAGPVSGFSTITTLRFSDDSERLVCGLLNGGVAVMTAADGQILGISPPQPSPVAAVAFHPDQRQLAVVHHNKLVHVCSLPELQPIRDSHIDARDAVHFADYLPSGELVVGTNKMVAVLEAETSAVRWSMRLQGGAAGRTPNFNINADGSLLAVATVKGSVNLFDLQTGSLRTLKTLTTEKIRSVRFCAVRPHLVVASYDAKVRVWDYEADRILHEIHHDHQMQYAEYSRDGRWIVSASNDDTVRVWNAADAALVVEPVRHGSAVLRADFHPSGRTIMTRSHSNEIRLFAFQQSSQIADRIQSGERAASVAYSPDSRWLAAGMFNGSVLLCEASSGQVVHTLVPSSARAKQVLFGPRQKRLLILSGDSDALLYDVTRPKQPERVAKLRNIWQAAFSHDGRQVVTAGKDGRTMLLNADDGRRTRSFMRSEELLRHSLISGDGRLVLSGATSGQIRMFAADSREQLLTVELGSRLNCLAFAPSGLFFVAGGRAPHATCWRMDRGTPTAVTFDHGGRVNAVAISPDERYVITTSHDNTARVWDPVGMQPVCPPLPHRSVVLDAKFSPDGRTVVTTSNDGVTRLWDVESGRLVQQPLDHGGHTRQLAFRPDGRQIAVAAASGVMLWNISDPPKGPPPDWLPAFAEALAGTRLGADTQLEPLPPARIEEVLEQVRSANTATEWRSWAQGMLNANP